MSEVDDRLVGDPVWKLFPDPAQGSPITRHYGRWLLAVGVVATCWWLLRPLAFVMVCLAVAIPDLRRGRQLVQSIPDKAGGTICARFSYAWAAWKFGVAAFVLMFVMVFVFGWRRDEHEPPGLEGMIVAPLWMAGFITSAAFTALGLLAAYRSGMRVSVGKGVNQARTLLLAMLIVGFVFVVLGPLTLWLGIAASPPRDGGGMGRWQGLAFFVVFIGCLFGGPVVILLVLDWVSRHVVADNPGKFGPKVPTVAKWEFNQKRI